MNIYCYDNYENARSEDFLRRALQSYVLEKELSEEIFNKVTNDKIFRGDMGKPYIEDCDIYFNVSHSELFWMCAVSTKPVGLDIQVVKDCNYEKMSKRYYNPEEQHMVDLWGEEIFFEIWVRKEAVAKLDGNSIFKTISQINTVKDGEFLKKIGDAYIMEIPIDNTIKCVAASKEDREICIRLIMG